MCFPLRTVAFRGHGFSLLALAKGMSTLFAKNGVSRPSLRYCGVFRRVLGLHTARPIKNICSSMTLKAPEAFTSHEENWFVFSKIQRFSAPNNHHNSK